MTNAINPSMLQIRMRAGEAKQVVMRGKLHRRNQRGRCAKAGTYK